MLLQETITGTLIEPLGTSFPVLGESAKCPSFGCPSGKRDLVVCRGGGYHGVGTEPEE